MYIRTAASHRSGARPLAREYYVSPRIFANEQDVIFSRLWMSAGRSSSLAQPGDYSVRSAAGESLLLVRGRDGGLRAFFNVCRHRGTRLCEAGTGHLGDVVRCPYHGWTYGFDGRLLGAPHMQGVEGFDPDDYGLHAAAVAEYGGFVFVNIAPNPPPFPSWIAPVAERLDRFELGRLQVGHSAAYDVRANWKLLFENYSECLHCPVIHPELTRRVPYQSSANDMVEGPFLGGYMEIAAANDSVTVSGRSCAPLLTEQLNVEDRRRAYYYSVMPNLLLSIHPDYVNYYLLTPVSADRTLVESEWLFRLDAASATVNTDDAVAFWDLVNRQDWRIVERSHSGISSSRYEPGPYSPSESLAAAWDREYLRLIEGAGNA